MIKECSAKLKISVHEIAAQREEGEDYEKVFSAYSGSNTDSMSACRLWYRGDRTDTGDLSKYRGTYLYCGI
jgi:hypothetical protein